MIKESKKQFKKLAIITPVYNTEKYLHLFFRSVLCQSFKDFDLYVVNDGSTDGSDRIIRNYEQEDRRVLYYKKTNSGVSSARNYALEKVKESSVCYEYIYFCDSDDMLADDCLSKLIDALSKDNFDYAVFSVDYLTKCNQKSHRQRFFVNEKMTHDDIVKQYFRLGWKWRKEACSEAFLNNKVFKSEYVLKFRFDVSLIRSEDFAFFMQILPLLKSGVLVPTAKYIYRRRKSSLTNTVFNDADLVVCKAVYPFLCPDMFIERYAISKKMLRAYYLNSVYLFEKGFRMESYKLIGEVRSSLFLNLIPSDLKVIMLSCLPRCLFNLYMKCRVNGKDREKLIDTYFD